MNAINIIGKGYSCVINFNHVMSCFYNTDNKTVSVKFNTMGGSTSSEVEYLDVIEVNYLDV